MGLFGKKTDADLRRERDEAQERCIMLRAELVEARGEIERLNIVINTYFAKMHRQGKTYPPSRAKKALKARAEGYIPTTAMLALPPEERPAGRCCSCTHRRQHVYPGRKGATSCAAHPGRRVTSSPHPRGGWCPEYAPEEAAA